MSATRLGSHVALVGVALGVVSATIALAQSGGGSAPVGSAHIVLRDGTDWHGDVLGSGLSVEETDVDEASCRSCVGRHALYSLEARFAEGPVETVSLFADVVGGHGGRLTIGSGPYPARVEVAVRLRGETADRPLRGSVEISGHHVEYRAPAMRAPQDPIREIELDFVARP